MKRIAIIIGNDGGIRNHLPGVSKDMANFTEYLKSDFGGAWEDNEIIIGKDWTTQSLEREITFQKAIRVDYFLIIFYGHGYAIKGRDTYFELADNDDLALSTLKRWLHFNKSLIIADSCRKYIEILEKAYARESLRFYSKANSPFRHRYREIYDQELQRLEMFHNTVVLSTDLNECADDTDEGGLYTKTLIETARSEARYGSAGIYSIRDLHDIAAEKVAILKGYRQNPQIYSTSDIMTPPFGVKPLLR